MVHGRSSRSWIVWLVLTLALPVAARDQISVSVYVEDSPVAQDLLDEAARLREQDRVVESISRYQQVIDEYAAKLMSIEAGLYVDAALWVRNQLLDDASLLEAYRRLQQPLAASVLSRAETAEQLADVLDRYPLTAAALDAGLRLAAEDLESARLDDAAVILDALADHPDLDRSADRWRLLRAAAAAFGAPTQAVPDQADLEQFDQWRGSLRPPDRQTAVDLFDPSPAQDWPTLPAQALWSIQSTTASPGRNPVTPLHQQRPNLLAQRGQDGKQRLMPVVVGDRVLVNDVRSVMALDRFSGRALWVYRSGVESTANDAVGRRMPASRGMYLDPRSVAVRGSVVAAVLGRAPAAHQLRTAALGQTWLTCLDLADGRLRWRLTPGDLDPAYHNSFFHSTPIVRGGRIFALVRRGQTAGGFNASFVVAIDARSGRLLWRRHLTSSAAGRGQPVRSLARMIYDRGRLFVADAVGSVACIEARTGTVRWLVISEDLPRPQQPGAQRTRRGSAVAIAPGNVPILCEAGLIVSDIGTDGATWLLDPDTGGRRRELSDAAWTDEADHLLRSPDGILAIGKHVRHFDGRTLKMSWTRQLGAAERRDPRGRPIVTQSHLVLPLYDHVLVLDLATGSPALRFGGVKAANVVVLDDQLIAADAASIAGYLSWQTANDQLTRRINDDAHAVDSALNLAYLSLITDHPQSLLRSLDAALRVASQRDAVFRLVRAIIDPDGAAHVPLIEQWHVHGRQLDDAVRMALFERMEASATEPAQIVAHHLALGRHLESLNRAEQAVARYQMVLLDASLATQDVTFGAGSRQAGLEATLRIGALVRKRGPSVYADFEAQARERLARMHSTSSLQPHRLIQLAQMYPSSTIATRARADAADLLHQSGRAAEALIQLRRAAAESDDEALLARVIGKMADIYSEDGRPGRARRLLARTQRDRPALRPWRQGSPVELGAWLELLTEQSQQQGRLPRLRLPLGEPHRVDGRLLTPTVQPIRAWPSDLCLIAINTDDGPVVRLLAGPQLQPKWTTAVPVDDLQLIALSREQALLWSPDAVTIIAINTPTGELAWRVDELGKQISQISGEALSDQQRRFRRTLNPNALRIHRGRVVPEKLPVPDGHLLVTNEQVLCVCDYEGRMIALDRLTGHVLWRDRIQMEQVHALVMVDHTLGVAGSTYLPDPNDARIGNLALLDPATGQEQLPLLLEEEPITWLGMTESGAYLYGMAKGVVARDLSNNELIWRYEMGDRSMFQSAQVVDPHVLLTDASGSLTILDVTAGQRLGGAVRPAAPMLSVALARRAGLLQRVALTPPPPVNKLRVTAAAERWHVLHGQSVEARHIDGNLLWRDAIHADVKRFILQRVGEHVVAVVNDEKSNDTRDYRLYLLDRAGGALLGEIDLPAADCPLDRDHAVMLDQAVVLTDQATVLVVPGAGSP